MTLPSQPALPTPLFTAEQVRAMDRFTIDDLGIPGIELMRRAGRAAFQVLRAHWPDARTVSVLCGSGNNGGDGYVVAKLALEAGLDVRVFAVAAPENLKGDAARAFRDYLDAGGSCLDFIPANFEGAEVLVDGLLGTGLDREVSGPYAAVIEAMNQHPSPILALDIPSGLNADTGTVLGTAVKADATASFIGLKQGLFTSDGPEHCGTVHFDDLGTPASVRNSQLPSSKLMFEWRGGWARRPLNSHKGRFGHVLVLGGDVGYTGAVRLAGEAALRVGAGLVSVGTRGEHAGLLNLDRPELMCHPVTTADDLQTLFDKATVIAVGPGLGQAEWGRAIWEAVLTSELPLVVDADALNWLAIQPATRQTWILTPHPGEAARLLQTSSREVQRNRFAAVTELQVRYGGTVVLKGSGSLVMGEGAPPSICRQGNPGMATGGMGDVLTGVIAGLIAQGMSLAEAARSGVCLHGLAGDCAAADGGERGLLASDLLPHLRQWVNR